MTDAAGSKGRTGPALVQGMRKAFGRGIGKGIATGALSKGAALATQLVAMPVALHALGAQPFGVLLMLLGLTQWVVLGNFGMNTTLARLIAGGDAREDLPDYLGLCLIFSFFAGLVLALLCGGIASLWLTNSPEFAAFPGDEVLFALVLLLSLMIAKTVTVTFQGVQLGRLKSYRVNIYQAAGQVAVIVLLIPISHYWPRLPGFVLALIGGLLIGDVLNARDVLKEVRPTFRKRGAGRAWFGKIVRTGLAYTMINLAAFGTTGFLVFLVGALSDAEQAAPFGLMMRLWMMLLSVLAVINLPLWPAMLDALERGDVAWLRHTVRRFLLLEAGTGLVAAAGAGFGLSDILHLWVRERFAISPLYGGLFALALFQGVLAYFWGIVLMGLRRERLVAATHALRLLVLLALGALVIPAYGGIGAMAALAIAYFLAETLLLPIMALRILKRLDLREAGEETI